MRSVRSVRSERSVRSVRRVRRVWRGGLDVVPARRQAGEPDAGAPVVHRVRPPSDLAPVLLYGPGVFVRERNAIRFCAGA